MVLNCFDPFVNKLASLAFVLRQGEQLLKSIEQEEGYSSGFQRRHGSVAACQASLPATEPHARVQAAKAAYGDVKRAWTRQ